MFTLLFFYIVVSAMFMFVVNYDAVDEAIGLNKSNILAKHVVYAGTMLLSAWFLLPLAYLRVHKTNK